MTPQQHKLGIIIPYRNRYDHLVNFKSHLETFFKGSRIKYELIIVEQDDAKTFNRGKLLNIGFLTAKKLKCDYVVFHDIDMLPVKADYSYSDVPLHMATNFVSDEGMSRIVFDEYFGGVTMFPMSVFEEINGYSNEYWGWGYEDNDLLYRCKTFGVPLDHKEIKTMGGNTASVRFNGTNSYVRCNNIINTSEPMSFFVNFDPDDIVCEPAQYDDTYAVFSIPGFDMIISYNSYKRYNFEIYDVSGEIFYINSDIKINYKTNICVTINPIRKVVKMYQDGTIIGIKQYEKDFRDYREQKYMYLGVGNPHKEKSSKYFRGTIPCFAIFSDVLKDGEVKELSNNQFFGLTQNFGDYHSSDKLKLYYDAKFIKNNHLIDLSGNNNDGQMINCEIVPYTFEAVKILDVPHKRYSTFRLMKHEENGYVRTGWKDITTRYNQLRYHNEVAKGLKNPKKDGLSTCEYKILNQARVENQTHIIVSI